MTGPSPLEPAIVAFRWVEYLGLLGFIGVLVIRRLAANQPSLQWARLPMHRALALALVGGLGTVVTQAVFTGGGGDAQSFVRMGRVVAEGLALGFCLAGVRFVVPPGLLAAVLLAFAGHGARVQPPAIGIVVDALHIVSAGMWGGGIIAMAFLRPPGGWGAPEGRALLSRFSRVAPLAFAMTALTGLLRATQELSGVSDLWTTSYGVVLSLKGAGVVAMLVLSWLAWRRGLPVARWEALVAAVVIGASALLAAYPATPGMGLAP